MKKFYKMIFTFILIFIINMDVKANTIEDNIDSIIGRIENYESKAFLDTHPVGSIYMTTSSDENTASKVANKYGGTWQAYGTDRVLRGTTGTVGTTGGATSVTLSNTYIPSHSHSVPAISVTTGSTGSGYSISHTYSNRTTSAPNTRESVAGYYSGFSTSEGTDSSYFYYLKIAAGQGSGGALASNVFSISKNHTHSFTEYYANKITGVGAHTHSYSIPATTTGANGSGTAFSIVDPYITTYIYKRVS